MPDELSDMDVELLSASVLAEATLSVEDEERDMAREDEVERVIAPVDLRVRGTPIKVIDDVLVRAAVVAVLRVCAP